MIAFFIVRALLSAPVFAITTISVEGLEYIPASTVQQFIQTDLGRRRWVFFRNNNYFLISLSRLRQRLQNEYHLDIVSMRKRFPHSLILTVKERIAGFVLQTPDKYISLDTKGSWISQVTGPLPGQTVIADERSVPGTIVSVDYLEKITDITSQWKELIQQVQLNKFHLTDDQTIIILSTNKGYKVYLSPSKDIATQLHRLATYLSDTGTSQPHEYIDLRFDESLYIK